MIFPRRQILLLLLLVLVIAPVFGGVPPEWRATDYPPHAPTHWYGVEVIRFPSRALAEGTRETLLKRGWGPVELREDVDGSSAVVVGETARIGDAWYLRDELRKQAIADGTVVSFLIDHSGRAARGFTTGSDLSPFDVSFPDTFDEGRLRRTLSALALGAEEEDDDLPEGDEQPEDSTTEGEETDPEPDPVSEDPESELAAMANQDALRNFLELWGEGRTSGAGVGRGAMIAARHFWNSRMEPEATLFLASRVASGTWGAPAESVEEARVMTADLLYGHRRDWHGAWGTTRVLEADRARPVEKRVEDRLRQAALMVELYQRGVDPAPTLARVRQHLRRSQEMLDDLSPDLSKRIQLFYLQTFAWEGNWDRVEDLSRSWLKTHGEEEEPTAHSMVARLMLAKSLERHGGWQEGMELLDKVLNTTIREKHGMRIGMSLRDPAGEARELRRRFRDQILVAPVPMGDGLEPED